MAKDAVLEIRIDNPQARQAFIEFWRDMEAQGYQYGYEALCNVWEGFDDGRKALARKVLEIVNNKHSEYKTECDAAAKVNNQTPNLWAARARVTSHLADLLRDLFQREGIEVEEEELKGE